MFEAHPSIQRRTYEHTMASFPSFGLGGSTNHSLRDVGLAEPNQEVDRPIASQGNEIDRRSFYALPVPSKPHNGAQLRGYEIHDSSPLNANLVNIITPPKPFAISAWNANDHSNRNTSEVRDSLNANVETYVRSRTPYNSMRTDTPNNTNPVGSKVNPMRMDMLDNANSICDSTNARSVRSEVRPSELIELSNVYEQTPSYAQAAPRANSANSYHYSEHITPIVRWSEPPVTGSNPRRTTLTPITQTPDLFIPDESVYYTARQTDRCSRERPTDTDIRERRTLEFDSAVEVHSAPRNRTKNDDTNTRRS